MAVRVIFEVFENKLMCNGHPVEIGVSNIQVEAQIVPNPEKLTITNEEDAAVLADSFDIGLVTVEITATLLDELKTDDGMVFRRLAINELITEVNGLKVIQTKAAQQILDVFENGLIKSTQDPTIGFIPDYSVNSYSSFEWWTNEDPTYGLIFGITVGFSLLTALFVLVYFIKKSRVSEYQAVQEEVKEQPPAYVEDDTKGHEDKKPFLA